MLAGAADETFVHRVDLAEVISTQHDDGDPPPWPTEVPRTGMVQWMRPKILLAAAKEVVVSALFARFADKREAEAALEATWFDASGLDEPLWLDYASDTGDGFEPTYAIASRLGCEDIRLNGERLPRGQILILGGDQVYPAADWDAYQDRFVDVYTAALPYLRGHPRPLMFALPGNHDWYDGLTSFVRLFCAQRSIGAWQTAQTRSYFAIKLGEKRWLWAVDTQLDTYVDNPQLGYFWEMAAKLDEDDEVILVTAKPSWVAKAEDADWNLSAQDTDPEDVPQSWQTLAFIEDRVIGKSGARVSLTLTGDQHHYAHYTHANGSVERHKITSGGAGAYLSATHPLPEGIHLPDHERLKDPRKGAVRDWQRGNAIFPPEAESRRIASLRSLFSPWLARHTPSFAVLTAVIYGLLGLSVWLAHVSTAVWTTLAVALTGGLFRALQAFADVRVGDRERLRWAKRKFAVVHTALHLGPLAVVIAVLLVAVGTDWIVFPASVVFGAVWGPTAFSLYLWWAVRRRHGPHSNEVFAAQSCSVGKGFKHFMRIRIDPDGGAKLYPVGVRGVPARDDWEVGEEPPNRPSPPEPWIEPPWFRLAGNREIGLALIEEPIEISASAE